MSAHRVGQALVTDPGAAGVGGYMLIAASPGVSAVDRGHLAAVPQVSDFLHLQKEPRLFFSFHRLPGGDWCFAKRLASGKRQSRLHRIVIHSLVVPESVLVALAWDAWLIPTCSFRRPEGEWLPFPTLTEGLADALPKALPDLELVTLQDAGSQRLQMLESRRGFLVQRWGEAALQTALAQVLAAVEAGQGALLPQTVEHEQLLALAWSALPRRDRAAIPWTTHLAPGSGALFVLANAPRPAESRAAETTPVAWALPAELAPRPAGLAIARALTTDVPAWARVASEWYELAEAGGLSLRDDGAQALRWVLFLERGGPPAKGFRSLAALGEYLDARALGRNALADPWARPVALLDICARTLANTGGKRKGETAAALLHQLVQRRGLRFGGDSLEELVRLGVASDVLLAAVELLLLSQRPVREVAGLLRCAIAAVAARGEEAPAARLAAQHVVPAIATMPELEALLGEDLALVLAALRTEPCAFVAALPGWSDELYDDAVARLQQWTREDAKAAGAIAKVIAEAPEPNVVRLRRSILHLSARLASCGAPAAACLRVALAEARLIDGEGDLLAVGRFAAGLAGLVVPAPVAIAAAADLRRHLRERNGTPGAACRTLVQRLAPALAVDPADTLGAFSFLEGLDGHELREWAAPLAALADALDRRQAREAASTLRRDWWTRLSGHAWEEPLPAARSLLEGLSETDREAVAQLWSRLVAGLPAGPMAEALLTLVDADPERRRSRVLATLRGRIVNGELPLAEGVAQLHAVVRDLPDDAERFLRQVDGVLPKDATKRVQELISLLLAPQLYPSTKGLLQNRLLMHSLARSGPELARWLRPPTAMQPLWRRGSLLLAVARRLGELASEVPHDGCDLLASLHQGGRGDAVAAFLRGAASARRPSFLEWLAQGNAPALAKLLHGAADDRAHRWDLAPFRPQLRALGAAAGRGGEGR